METVVVLSACRTPIGKFQGELSSLSASDLGAVAVTSAVERAGLTADQVDEVILGNVVSAGTGQAPARQAALKAGLPSSVAAVTINKVCGSGLKAIMLAAQAIRCGDARVIVAGGMESMSGAPYLLPRNGAQLGNRTMIDSLLHDGLVCAFSGESMGVIAERLARSDGFTRSDQDRYAAESHRRAIAAFDRGDFNAEIVPVRVRTRAGEADVQQDEGPRADSTVEQLARLRPAFDNEGTVTAGNASMISDGAAALVVSSQAFAEAHGVQPLARILGFATAGTNPEDLFVAPVPAVCSTLDRCGLTTADIDLFEINEAFAAQMLACLGRLELSSDCVNVNGGAIALGHPIGASGARVAVTLIHALGRREQRLGVASLCLGGGNAVAAIVERIR